MSIAYRILLCHQAGNPKTYKHTDTVSSQRYHTLRGCPYLFASLIICIDLPGYKKEIVTDSMKNDTGIKHPDARTCVSKAEKEISRAPCSHCQKQHLFDA